jgi:murein DD-endopeptidase MepM/ murein hydrolase activator NlpD
LLAGYTFGFTPEAGTLPDTLKRPLASKTPGAQIVAVSDARVGTIDLQKMPLPLNAHMRLPFPRGEEWRVSQGTHNSSGSHQGYAVFAWDFVRSGSGSEGKPFLSCAPGKVTALNETQSSGTSAANFVTVQQAAEEFCDYIHLKKDSVPVKEGDEVGFGAVLGAVSNTGADSGAHLHLAVTTNGEEHARGSDLKQFFFTIPVAFSNYEVKHKGSGDWKRVIRGIPRDEDIVRNPAEDGPILYNAVWEKGSAAEVQVYDWKLAQLKEKDQALREQGWRIHHIRSASIDGVPRYAVVWRKRAGDEELAFELTKDAFEDKHASFARRGWMLHAMTASLKSGAARYTGAWKPGTVQQELKLAQPRAQCEAEVNQRNGEGWRLETIAAFSLVSVDLYASVWTRQPRRPESRSYEFVHGVQYQAFRSRYDDLWKDAWRLSHLSVCHPQGQAPMFTAYWEQEGGPEIQVYRWNYEDVRARYDVLWELGWRLKMIEPYTR